MNATEDLAFKNLHPTEWLPVFLGMMTMIMEKLISYLNAAWRFT